MDVTNKKLAFAIVKYLNSFCSESKTAVLSKEAQESLEVATQCIQDAFQVDASDEKQQHLFSCTKDLKSIFELFLKTETKKSTSTTQKPEVSEAQKKKAEELKLRGNKLVTEQKYSEAIDLYTEAIQCDPTNPVYLSNRAAAYSQQSKHALAIDDAEKALELDPTFSKAYSRMGHAYYQLGDYPNAVSAYTRGLDLDPSNTTMQQALAQAQKKVPHVSETSPDTPSSSSSSSSSPSTSPPSLDAMASNPGFLAMAQQMLQSNPGLASMAQQMLGGNPTSSSSSSGRGRGAGGADAGSGLQDLLSRPELQQMAQQAMSDPNFMQNLAGMFGGGGQGASSRRS